MIEKIYSNEELIKIIHDFYKQNNRVPTMDDFRHGVKPNASTFTNRFGSWKNTLKVAGLKKDKSKITGYTDKELIDLLIKYYNEFNKAPTTRDFKANKDYPNPETYRARFGNWKEALIKADLYDLRKDKKLFERISYSDDELIKMFKNYIEEFLNKNNKLPTNQDILNCDHLPNPSIFSNRFNGLINFYKCLGYDVPKNMINQIETKDKTNLELLEELENILKEYGQISCNNFTDYGLSSYKTYVYRFNLHYHELIELLGFEPIYHNNGHITMTDEEVINAFYNIKNELKHIPTLIELNRYAKENNIEEIDNKIVYRWGKYSLFLKELGELNQRKLKMYFSDGGDRCYSQYELITSNILYKNKIIYDRNLLYKNFIKDFDKEWTVDYYLPFFDLYIEVFGMVGIDEYDKKVIKKQELMKNNGLKLISIFPQDFKDNNYKMEEFILQKINQLTKY